MATILLYSVSSTTNHFVKQAKKSHLHISTLHSLPQNSKFPEYGCLAINTTDKFFKIPQWNGRKQLNQVVKNFEDMVWQGFKPDAFEANQFVDSLYKLKRSEDARRVIDLIISSGCPLNPLPCITLMTYLCEQNRLTSAAILIEKMEKNGYATNTSMYNILVKNFISRKEFKLAWQFVGRLCHKGIIPTSHTYSILLEGVCMESGVDEAMRLSEYLKSNSRKLNLCSYNTLLSGLCGENRVDEAVSFFRTWEAVGMKPSHVSYETLVEAFCYKERWGEAKELLMEMIENCCLPTESTYSVFVSVLAHHGRTDDALGLIEEMIRKGFKPNIGTYNLVIEHLCKLRKVGDVVKCFKHMRDHNCEPSTETYNALAVLCKVGTVQEALTIINRFCTSQKLDFEERRCVYRDILHAWCMQRNVYSAFQLLLELTEQGFTPNSCMYSILLVGLCDEKMIGAWLQVSEMMEGGGFKVSAKDYSSLLHSLCTSGKTDLSLEIYCMMIEKGCMPSESTYKVIVIGLVLEKETRLAAQILKELYLRRLIGKRAMQRLILHFDLKDFVHIDRLDRQIKC